MRLYNIYFLCKENYDIICGLEYVKEGSVYVIKNWKKYSEALLAIRNISTLTNLVDGLYRGIPAFIREDEKPATGSDIYSSFMKKHRELVGKMTAIIELYDSMQLKTGVEGLDVKMPSVTSLDEYIDNLQKLDFVLTKCPYMQEKDTILKFGSVDVGSNWISLFFDGAMAVSMLGMVAVLIDKALILRSHYLSLKEQEESLKAYRIKNNMAGSVEEIFEEMKKACLNKVLDDIENEKNVKTKNGEERGMAEQSMEKLCVLLDRGMEIYASLDVSEEIKPLFPTIGSNSYLPDNIIKALEDKESGEE